MSKLLITLCLSAAVFLLPLNSLAFDLGVAQINGFVSQGYLNSSGNNFLDPDSKDGTFNLNEIGLTFQADVTEQMQVAIRLLSRKTGGDGDNDVTVDWAYGDYRFFDWLGVRAGKLKLPIGFYGQSRDSEFSRPMAFLPQGFYDEMHRGILYTGNGVSLYGNIPAGKLGSVDYQFFYGELYVDDDNYLINKRLKEKGLSEVVDEMSDGQARVTSFDYKNDKPTYSASLIYNTFVEGLRIGGSYFESRGTFEVELDTSDAGLSPGLILLNLFDTDITANYDPYFTVSAEYKQPLFTISAEYMERGTRIGAEDLYPILGKKAYFIGSTSSDWYVMGTLNIPQVPGLSVSAMYDEFYLNKNDKNEDKAYKYRKDIGVGLRYDINPDWLVKIEYHDIDGAGVFTDTVNDELDDHWSYYAVKTAFRF